MKVNSVSNQSFGMTLRANGEFLSAIAEKVMKDPYSKTSDKIFKQLHKIRQFPLNDTYEIQKINNSFTKEVKNSPIQFFQNIIEEGYRLVDKTKNETVLEKIASQPLKKYYNPKVKPENFLTYITKNLKKLAKLEKLQ